MVRSGISVSSVCNYNIKLGDFVGTVSCRLNGFIHGTRDLTVDVRKIDLTRAICAGIHMVSHAIMSWVFDTFICEIYRFNDARVHTHILVYMNV